MTTQESSSFASVWDAIETHPMDAAEMARRSELCSMLLWHARQRRWTIEQAARQMDVSPDLASALFSGDVDSLDIATLESMRAAAGLARSG